MARPVKESMPYFSHDTDCRRDRKIKLFLANCGLIGHGFYFAVLENLYNNSYFAEWTEEDMYLFAAEFNCGFSPLSYQDVTFLTEQALKWKLFDREIYDKHEVLTSPAVQSRYLKQSARRVLVEMQKEYLLIDLNGFYKRELETSTVSVKVVEGMEEKKVIDIYGDYKEGQSQQAEEKQDKKLRAEAKSEYQSKYDFDSDHKWDGDQPIDYSGCLEQWNIINKCRLRVAPAKRQDLRRVFRTYTGKECLNALVVRAKDENMKDSKWLTQWSTLFGAKKLENLDKWVDRGREWLEAQNSLETVDDHISQGWMNQSNYAKVCGSAGIAFEDPMFCETKNVQGQLLYYPKFDY